MVTDSFLNLFLICNKLEQIEFKLEKKILGFRNIQEKLEKRLRVDYKELTSRIDYCPTGTIDSSPKVEVSTDLSTPVSIFNFVGPLLS